MHIMTSNAIVKFTPTLRTPQVNLLPYTGHIYKLHCTTQKFRKTENYPTIPEIPCCARGHSANMHHYFLCSIFSNQRRTIALKNQQSKAFGSKSYQKRFASTHFKNRKAFKKNGYEQEFMNVEISKKVCEDRSVFQPFFVRFDARLMNFVVQLEIDGSK